MNKLEELGFQITHSGPCPKESWGKYWIQANKVDEIGTRQGTVYGYGDDEAAAIANAVTELENHKDEPKSTH